MIKYNVTVRVDPQVESEWITWMKSDHIPAVMDSGIFSKYEFSEMIDPIDPDIDAKTFTVQYWCDSVASLNRYFKDYAPALRNASKTVFGEKCLAFRSVMKSV